MPSSILDAIKQGHWDYEPDGKHEPLFDRTDSMPGSQQKLAVLAERVQRGLPLWHPEDRITYDDRLRE